MEPLEKYGVRSFIEIALNDGERVSYLAKSLADKAVESSLCQEDSSKQELIYTGMAFLEELDLSPEEISKKIADRLEYTSNGYQSGSLKKLDPKLGEVAGFVQGVIKVAEVLKRWDEIDSNCPEPFIEYELGDMFSDEVESRLRNESLTNEIARCHKLFRTPFGRHKATFDLGSGVKVVMKRLGNSEYPEILNETLDLWASDHNIEGEVPDHVRQQLGKLQEAFHEHLENYRELKSLSKSRELQANKGHGLTF